MSPRRFENDVARFAALLALCITAAACHRESPSTCSHGEQTGWLRTWTHDTYLWYAELPDPDPASYPSPQAYFEVRRTSAVTASGHPKDRFHFWIPTADWAALSQSGVNAGYGVRWVLLSAQPPRELAVLLVEPGSPAAQAGLDRGARVLTIDGVDVATGTNTAALNAGISPATLGESHTFEVRDRGASGSRTITLTSANVASTPVRSSVLETATGKVGYILFNDHIATAEPALATAIEQLRTEGVADVILDLRYNGGGFLAVASELAYELAGPAATAGKPFEALRMNDHFAADTIRPEPFHTTQVLGTQAALPHLDLTRVFVITGPGTCSASESVINGLRGVDVEVVLIGGTTCGKPYGFFPADNCGTTYFTIQFEGTNAKGFGDYADGFTPGGSGPSGVPGCIVPDDIEHPLGDPAEGKLAAALSYRAGQGCPAAPAGSAKTAPGGGPSDPVEIRQPWRENRILWRPE